MKKLFAIVLICCMSFQFLMKIGITGYYLMNQQYIANFLCINKAEPGRRCNGKCYLAKQMNKTEDREDTPSRAGNLRYETIEFIGSTILTFPEKAGEYGSTTAWFKPYLNTYTFNSGTTFFHPPCC